MNLIAIELNPNTISTTHKKTVPSFDESEDWGREPGLELSVWLLEWG